MLTVNNIALNSEKKEPFVAEAFQSLYFSVR